MAAKIFIDGEAGTTGLQIRERLEGRGELSLLCLGEGERKDSARRAEMLNSADIVILCLPDEAARDAVAMIENDAVRVIDASSAHRVAPGWVYGFPEYDAGQSEKIAAAKQLTNPGCYALASISLLHPLVSGGLLPADFPATINAVSGYSGGGRKMISAFEEVGSDDYCEMPFMVYGLGLRHKHVPEIQTWAGLDHAPLLVPGVGRFRQGMIVQIPLQLWALPGSPSSADIHRALAEHYAASNFVKVRPLAETSVIDKLEPEGLNGTNELHLYVFANDGAGQAVMIARIDNLGKGASGQAVQNMNIMLGLNETTGL